MSVYVYMSVCINIYCIHSFLRRPKHFQKNGKKNAFMNNIRLYFLYTGNGLHVCPIFPYRLLLPLSSSTPFDSMWTHNEGTERIWSIHFGLFDVDVLLPFCFISIPKHLNRHTLSAFVSCWLWGRFYRISPSNRQTVSLCTSVASWSMRHSVAYPQPVS